MEARRVKVDRSAIAWTNDAHHARIECYRRLVENVTKDGRRSDRKAKQECVVCFYTDSRIGGAAMTTRQCAHCDVTLHSGSTNIDVLCLECAKAAKLCKHCGADIDLINRRKRTLPEVNSDL